MTDRERLLGMLEMVTGLDSLESILQHYLFVYLDSISIIELSEINNMINEAIICKARDLETIKRIANERAGCIKSYLEGNMWKTEEDARRNVKPQIGNAQAIINACNGKIDMNFYLK